MSTILLFKKRWVPPVVSLPFSVGNVYKPNMQIRVLLSVILGARKRGPCELWDLGDMGR